MIYPKGKYVLLKKRKVNYEKTGMIVIPKKQKNDRISVGKILEKGEEVSDEVEIGNVVFYNNLKEVVVEKDLVLVREERLLLKEV